MWEDEEWSKEDQLKLCGSGKKCRRRHLRTEVLNFGGKMTLTGYHSCHISMIISIQRVIDTVA